MKLLQHLRATGRRVKKHSREPAQAGVCGDRYLIKFFRPRQHWRSDDGAQRAVVTRIYVCIYVLTAAADVALEAGSGSDQLRFQVVRVAPLISDADKCDLCVS